MERRQFIAVFAGGALVAATRAFAQGPGTTAPDTRPRWGQQAEKEFRMGRGLAPRLMTEEEWTEHQRKMRTMTPEQREKYRQEVHQKMLERAREQGVTEVPPRERIPGRRPGT
jgi:hypothetical protein